MRKAYNGLEIIDHEGDILGICLGYDFTAEHEWGIKGINRTFGIDTNVTKKNHGFEARKITNNTTIHFHKVKDTFYIASRKSVGAWSEREHDWSEYRVGDTVEFASWWDENDFLIAHKNEILQNVIQRAFNNMDVCITLTGGGAFRGSGICILELSKIPADVKENASRADLSYLKLSEKVDKTGIKRKLEKANCGYYALSPRWANEEETEIQFWLNPREQQQNNSGWYTEKQLIEWTNGKGPIPKK